MYIYICRVRMHGLRNPQFVTFGLRKPQSTINPLVSQPNPIRWIGFD